VGLLVSGFGLSIGSRSTAQSAQNSDNSNPFHLRNGKVFINDQAQPGTYSAEMTNFRFLYFYIPAQGLFVISDSQFNHAVEAGKFEDRELQFDVSGIAFKLVSSRTMLGKTGRPLWLNYDPRFTLDVKSIMFGYGDSESAPYDWPKQIGKHI
jgi:hypothetical protein